ncbi:MAG TPA: heavy metal-associated domain-containing protein [Chitinophagales bacterium]|nr:heavy metal-associated domain-containing protein [Chitinophagales bacterium]
MKVMIKQFASAIILILVMSVSVYAAGKGKSAVVTIKTSAICGSCKVRLEKAVKAVDGVEEALLNLNSKKMKIKYNPDKTSPERLREVISATGYDADGIKKNEQAFGKLPQCCQVPMPGDKD